MMPQQPLSRSEFCRLLFEQSPIPFVLMDSESFRFLDCNDAAVKIYGFGSYEATVGRTPADVSPPFQMDGKTSSERAKAFVREALEIGYFGFEWLNRKPDGTLWNSEVKLSRAEIDGKTYLFFSVIEITGHKKTQEALRNSEEKYRELFELTPAPMLIYARQGLRFLAVNEAFRVHYGYTREDVDRMVLTDLYPEDEKAKIADLILRLRGHAYVGEWHHRKKDGVYINIFVHSHDILFDGEPARIAVVTDITDFKKAEAEKHGLQRQLLQAQKMEAIGQLAGGVAHDFNNILTAILLHVDLLQHEPGLSPDMADALEDVETSVKKASDLTRHLLMFSRRQVAQLKTFDLNSILGNFVKMLRRLIGENIRLQFMQVSDNLWVEADPNMLEQVVMNLSVNARDAMPDGGTLSLSTGRVTLDAERCRSMESSYPGNFVFLSVSDTGCGMSEELLKKIFEPFFTTKEAGKGTGLGLATVYGIMQMHRGWVQVESAPGKGSTFTVYFPESKQVAPAIEVKAEDAIPRGTENLLFVEDEPSLRKAVPAMLRKLGYRVRVAANGLEAQKEWGQAGVQIDLLVSDVIMPGGVTGLELADRFCRQKKDLKVILMSGYSSELATQGFSRGPNLCFISKPFTGADIARLVRSHLDKP